ncbi:triphosphoribosyl-dephospho-CoA synthase [Methanoplanus sp. FWC-SCC4]|uniref:Triphosphoribosyl-dephospho-CoA synthase n=1 Tax=Methanochimaera problematica TaxID=2609417 RepID=A0AA97FF62_9EURY|nr:triphosphoribosyl-dephospho-CoA synthase [Methanoplanus sp. FWC-SCC4]WOF16311.1 triphosphoribosyl-dephospho-CoA synthase [Methanoplanus sp. FWC-SCC4]
MRSPAENAQLAMMLEVCAEVKPGNVDRHHDYEDTSLQHFLASTIFVRPVFKRAENSSDNIGRLIYDAVSVTNTHSGGNTHFGAFILLIPLIAGGGIKGAKEIVKNTTVDDAVMFYRAFGLTKVRMKDSDLEMDVNDPSATDSLIENNTTLYDVMEYSSTVDMVAAEWINGFSLTRKTADFLKNSDNGQKAIIDAFMNLLASETDTFVVKKLGSKTAEKLKNKAKEALDGNISLEELDRICLLKGINPGSLADITIAGIFVALMEGWNWDF